MQLQTAGHRGKICCKVSLPWPPVGHSSCIKVFPERLVRAWEMFVFRRNTTPERMPGVSATSAREQAVFRPMVGPRIRGGVASMAGVPALSLRCSAKVLCRHPGGSSTSTSATSTTTTTTAVAGHAHRAVRVSVRVSVKRQAMQKV